MAVIYVMASTAWRPHHTLRLPEGIPVFSLCVKEENLLLGVGVVMPPVVPAPVERHSTVSFGLWEFSNVEVEVYCPPCAPWL